MKIASSWIKAIHSNLETQNSNPVIKKAEAFDWARQQSASSKPVLAAPNPNTRTQPYQK